MSCRLRAGEKTASWRFSKSEEVVALIRQEDEKWVEAKRSELRKGLTRRQRIFILEKLAGLNLRRLDFAVPRG
jgi:uncharacterized protein YbcI